MPSLRPGPRPSPRPVSRSGPRLTHRAAVLGLVLLVLVISYASSLRAFFDQRQQIEQTRAQIEQASAAVADLEREQRRWADDSFVAQQARARLAYVLPGEVGYRVIMPDGESLGAAPDPGAEAAADRSWYVTLWQSSRRAGRAP